MTKFGLCASWISLKIVGPGMVLFFHYSFFIFLSLLITFIIYGLYMIIYFSGGSNCENRESEIIQDFCGTRWRTVISAGNRADQFVDVHHPEKILASIVFVVLLGLRIGYFAFSKKLDSIIDEQIITPFDYSIKVKGLPNNVTKAEVEDHFNNIKLESGRKVEVEKVCFAYKVGPYIEDVRQKLLYEALVRSMNRRLERNEKSKKSEERKEAAKQKLLKSREEYEAQVKRYKTKIRKRNDDLKVDTSHFFAGTAFVTFKKMKHAEDVLDEYSSNYLGDVVYYIFPCLKRCFEPDQAFIKDTPITISAPPEPIDIIWEHLGAGALDKFKRRLFTTFIMALVILFTFAIITSVKYLEINYLIERSKAGQNSFSVIMSSFGVAIFIAIANNILELLVRYICAKERHTTFTTFHISVAAGISMVRISISYLSQEISNKTRFKPFRPQKKFCKF